MMDQPKAWERQPGETSPAWEARSKYLTLGPGRSLERVSQELSKSLPLMKRWSKRWGWVAKAALYDAYVDDIASEAAAQALAERTKAQVELWTKRDDEQPNGDYNACLFVYNKLVEIHAGKVVASLQEIGMIVRSLALLSPIARAARSEMAARRANLGHDTTMLDDKSGLPDYIPGRRLAVLKTFIEYQQPGED